MPAAKEDSELRKDPAATARAFSEQLRGDRLIKIFIGQNNEPAFLVAESTIRAASTYFERAMDNEERMGSGEKGVLRFPEDEVEPWHFLLYYMHKSTLPDGAANTGKSEVILVKSWILGDKYLIPDFQDLVMLELLRMWDSQPVTLKAVQATFCGTSSESNLAKAVSADLVHAVYYSGEIEPWELACLEGIPGAIAAITTATSISANSKHDLGYLNPRFLNENDHGLEDEDCKRFLVASGPRKHWAVQHLLHRRDKPR